MLLSTKAAQLVALLLNTLYGIVQYGQDSSSVPSVDLVWGMRIIQGESELLADFLSTRAPPPSLIAHLRNLTEQAQIAADKLTSKTRKTSPIQYEKFRRFLSVPFAFVRESSGQRRAVGKLIWPSRSVFSSNLTDELSNACISELFSSDGDCRPSPDCLQAMLTTKYLANYALSRQLIYFTLANSRNLCRRSLLSYFKMNTTAMQLHLTELCSNVVHEVDLFLSRVPANLHSLTPLQKDLLMQHVFVCGQHGFVDVIRPRILWMIFAQQTDFGCYPLPDNDAPPDIGRRLLAAIASSDRCSSHSTAVAAGAAMVFLHHILISDSWADFHLADAAFEFPHENVDVGRFEEMEWREWTKLRDDDISIGSMGDPPPISHYRNDILAFFLLVLVILALLGIANYYCLPTQKLLYAYSYKKL